MFAKPQKVSGSSLLKNKDAKKLRKDVAAALSATVEAAQVEELLPSKTTIKKMSFQAPSRTVIYASEDTKEPLILDASGKGDYCFTVYALWRVASLLPVLTVHAPVSEFVLRGADVMLPGVVFSSVEEIQALRKGQLRAVVARGNPAPFAVGELVVDAADLEKHGKKGKALKLVHYVGDELWKMGPQTVPNEGFLGQHVVPLHTPTADGREDDAQTNAGVVDANDVNLEEKPAGDEAGEREESEDGSSIAMGSADDMDALFEQTLLQVLKTGSLKEKQLPILASTFHSTIFLPCRPTGATLNVKQSSFKKLSVFLKQMEAKGLLSLSEKDGVQSIVGICRRHPDVLAHEKYTSEAETAEERALDELKAQAGGLSLRTPPAGQFVPELEIAIGLSPALKLLFANDRAHSDEWREALDSSRKHWAIAHVRDLITKYIELSDLVDPSNKKFVPMNGPLTDAVFGRKAPPGGYPARMLRPELLNMLLARCSKYHRVKLYPGHEPRFQGGEIRRIEITAEKSKKHASSTVTTIAYYQQFGIDGPTFAKDVQKKWGCSATTQPSIDKNKGEEIKIQGQMVQEVLEYLDSVYHIATAKHCVVSYGKNVKAKKK